ncbi:hypothetical protein ACFVAE_15690 [Microbacterium sp. NPDC057659]|uniref:hypothetical protein n=1 Tax=Microbacterium sp. NPDC057659 TaxID=3346198 RepID=UPI00366D9786
MTSYPALGFDPAPGDLTTIEGLVDTLTRAVDDVDDSLTVMSGGDDSGWIGESGDAFRSTLAEDFHPQLRDSGEALRLSRNALQTWATQLAGHQSEARRLEQEAASAQSSVATKSTAATQAKAAADADDAAPDAAGDADDASRALELAQGELDGIISRAQDLKRRVDDDASTTAGLLVAARSPLEAYQESGWSSFMGFLGDAAEGLGEFILDDLIPFLEDVLRFIAPIISIAAIFFPALAPLAFGIALALVAFDGIQALTGRGSWGDFAIGVLGIAVGAAGGAAIRSAFGAGNQIPFAINLNRMMPALAGGGSAAGSLAGSLSLNFKTMMANAYWLVDSTKSIYDNVNGYYDEVEKHS